MPLRDQHGFLMVDVLLASLIITVALVAVTGMFIRSLSGTDSAHDYTVAVSMAQQEIADFKEKTEIKNDAILTSLDSYPYHPSAVQKITPLACMISTSADVLGDKSRGDADPYNKIIEVSVGVTWKKQGREYNVQLTTYCLRNLSYSIFAK
jgi:hypothetical protein